MRGFEERNGIKATLNAPEEIGTLPSRMEMAVFRIIQDALTNVQRHSESPVATIHLRRESEQIRLEIEDEGRGLAEHLRNDHAAIASGLGIAGMQQRARELGGHMDIRSTDAGTRITITLLPLSAG